MWLLIGAPGEDDEREVAISVYDTEEEARYQARILNEVTQDWSEGKYPLWFWDAQPIDRNLQVAQILKMFPPREK